ncbi:unnamed protein product [Amoebophrya sp. A120]|nr:unnamed protein product [Amoebophrya sp. A120]|eukprot:GSA120T00019755001.1
MSKSNDTVRTEAEWRKMVQDGAGGRGNKIRGTYQQVWNGTRGRTASGLYKSDLMMNAEGKIVSKKRSKAGKKKFAGWHKACAKAKQKLDVGKKGRDFVPIGGVSRDGKKLLKEAKQEYTKIKAMKVKKGKK